MPHFVTGGAAVELFATAERLNRLAAVARVDAIAAVERTKVHRLHGHASAHAMVRHLGRLSSGESARADKIRRMVAGCELLEAAWRAGDMSVDQAAVLARGYSNPRVRDEFIRCQGRFLDWLALPFPRFERKVADWVRLVDQDGPVPRPEPAHENRDVSLVQDHFSQQWTLRGGFGSLQGASMRRVLDAYTSAERLSDWEAARAVHGDSVCRDDLARTDAQHRADALAQIFADAVNNPERSVPIDTCHNVVWSRPSFEHALRRFCGDDAAPVDIDDHRCETLDGHPLNPTAAFADMVVSSWRSIVVSADRISLDASAKQRFYVGLARLGVQINHDSCFWHGCNVAPTQCQIDHREPAARGGLTTQANGGPACEKHNRLKERGYTVLRLPDGTYEIRTPCGEIIPA